MGKLLIDGDIVIYRCGFATEKTLYLVDWQQIGEPVEYYDNAKDAKAGADDVGRVWCRKEVEPVENALELVKNVISDIKDRYPVWSDCHIYLSPSVGNFRDRIATRAKYKGNRDQTARPVHFGAIRDYLVSAHGAEYTIGQEADDAIGIQMSEHPGSTCVSIDKDLLQLPGRHYNWVDKSERIVTPKEGAKFFWQQALSGDATDNVPGCKGIGAVKAERLLADCKTNKECWDKVLEVYTDVHGEDGPAFALETARLVYVRKRPNEVWSPRV